MSEEQNKKDIVRPYVVDGIEEYDNPMPPWWVAMFYLTIIFGLFYMIWVHLFGWNSLEIELTQAEARYAENQAAQASKAVEGAVGFDQRVKDTRLIASGKDLFLANCGPCHGNAGEGVVGPNLTDEFWLHGGKPAEILALITKGAPEKGMVAWGNILGPAKIEAVTAYVVSIYGSNPPNAKTPQGEEVKP